MDHILNYNKNESFDDFYETLGCDENSSTEQILCEYKIRALLLHPDKNRCNTQEAEEKFRKLQKAKDILTDSEKRKSYDKWRTSGISMTFEKWNQLGKDVHNSMHWIKRNKNELMLECTQNSESDALKQEEKSQKCYSMVWNKDIGDEMLRKFRNYEI